MSKTKTDNNQSVSPTRRSPVATARQERKPKRKARPASANGEAGSGKPSQTGPYWSPMPLAWTLGPGRFT